MVRATKDQIGDALDYEITDWRETQRSAIHNISWPALPNQPALFKTAAMFNFGVDATKAVYPASIVGGIISCASVHLFILKKAEAAFRTQYQAAVNRANKELQDQFTMLSDSFISEIQDICRNFKNSLQGREMTDSIYRAVEDIEFRDDRQRDALLRQLIRDAKLIETDPAVIRAETSAGFTRLCVKIRDLWRASYHDAWTPDAVLWYSGSTELFWFASGKTGQKWAHARSKADQDWIIRNAWRMKVRYIKNPSPILENGKRDNCYATLVGGREITQTYTGGVVISPDALSVAAKKLRQSI